MEKGQCPLPSFPSVLPLKWENHPLDGTEQKVVSNGKDSLGAVTRLRAIFTLGISLTGNL